MKYILFTAFFLAANIYYAQSAFRSIYGTAIEANTNEPLTFAIVEIKSDGFSSKTFSNIDGIFYFNDLPNGNYTIRIQDGESSTSYPEIISIDTLSSETLYRSFSFYSVLIKKEKLTVCYVRIPYLPENPTLNYQEIQQSVNKYQLTNLIQGISSNAVESDEGLSLNGARGGNYLFLIDGVKCRELHQVPSASMKSVTIMSHYIPAKYGDTSGGVIMVETMSYMDLYYERERRTEF